MRFTTPASLYCRWNRNGHQRWGRKVMTPKPRALVFIRNFSARPTRDHSGINSVVRSSRLNVICRFHSWIFNEVDLSLCSREDNGHVASSKPDNLTISSNTVKSVQYVAPCMVVNDIVHAFFATRIFDDVVNSRRKEVPRGRIRFCSGKSRRFYSSMKEFLDLWRRCECLQSHNLPEYHEPTIKRKNAATWALQAFAKLRRYMPVIWGEQKRRISWLLLLSRMWPSGRFSAKQHALNTTFLCRS